MSRRRWGVPAQPSALAPAAANVGTLLLQAYRAFERELFRDLHAKGHGALRPKHGAVLANVGAGGSRASALAAQAGMTRASMGELVGELEALGYVRRAADPADARAKRVFLTASGLEVAQLAGRAIGGIERRWSARVGRRSFRTLGRALDRLARPT